MLAIIGGARGKTRGLTDASARRWGVAGAVLKGRGARLGTHSSGRGFSAGAATMMILTPHYARKVLTTITRSN